MDVSYWFFRAWQYSLACNSIRRSCSVDLWGLGCVSLSRSHGWLAAVCQEAPNLIQNATNFGERIRNSDEKDKRHRGKEKHVDESWLRSELGAVQKFVDRVDLETLTFVRSGFFFCFDLEQRRQRVESRSWRCSMSSSWGSIPSQADPRAPTCCRIWSAIDTQTFWT